MPDAVETDRRPVPETGGRIDLSDLLGRLGDGVDEAPSLETELTDPRDLERPKIAHAAIIESTGGIEFSPSFATFGARLVGLVVDSLATAALMTPGLAVILTQAGVMVVVGGLLMVAGFVGATWSYARSVAATGRWIGNRVSSTTVVDVTNGRMLSGANAAARFVARMLMSPIFLFGFLMALSNTQRRTFHDQIAGSVVTRPPRSTWSIGDETE